MSADWTFAEMVDLLVAGVGPLVGALDPPVVARASLPHAGEDLSDFVAFGISAVDQEKIQTGLGAHSHDEEVLIGCIANVVRYGSGDDEALECRDRAVEIIAIIDEYCRENPVNVGTQTLSIYVDNREFVGFPVEIGEGSPARVATITFDIDYRARTNP